MQETGDEPLFRERAAGIDIGKQTVMVTIRVPSDTRRGGRQQETREFGTTRRQLLELADWLRVWDVERAGMESTSDYWKPVYFLLEREGFDCVLYHASQVRALPGRAKTDKLDSAWLARVTERGSLAGSFVPPEDIRRLRTCTRYRRRLTQARTAEKQRVEKLLEDAHLKLSSVISDIHGVSGRDMLSAIIAGERNSRALAALARGTMRRKTAALEEALDCSFLAPEHVFVLQMMLGNIDHFTAQIAVLGERIAALCEPWEQQIAQLDAIPGIGVVNAQDLIAEIGVDMSAFPTAGHLCSWARLAPRVTESGGRRKGKSATGRGNPYIGAALGDAAATAGRTQTFLAAKYRRLCRHMPKKKAQGAIMRTQLAAAHALLSDPQAAYIDLGPGYYEQRAGARRRASGHVRSLERLGWRVTLEPIDPGAGELATPAAS
jgi:transposase